MPAAHDAESDTAEHATLQTMAQAFKDLSKGEQTAAAMENKLSALEQKIDALLASVDELPSGGASEPASKR